MRIRSLQGKVEVTNLWSRETGVKEGAFAQSFAAHV